MRMKYDYETIDITNCSIPEVMLALETWQAENPQAVDTNFGVCYDGDGGGYTEVTFMRPMTEMELDLEKIQRTNAAEYQEARDRTEYERLKAKYEGN